MIFSKGTEGLAGGQTDKAIQTPNSLVRQRQFSKSLEGCNRCSQADLGVWTLWNFVTAS